MEEGEEGLPDATFHEKTLEDVQNARMMELEEGEIGVILSIGDDANSVNQGSCGKNIMELEDGEIGVILSIGDDANSVNQGSCGKNQRSKKKKKKRGNKGNSEPNLKDIDRFVSDVCRRLKERKSYMVYMAVGCLGISAVNQLVKEVDAVQACGGQKTSDGRHFRTGGGVLWNLLKSRHPNAYKEIMKRAKEFEKQFRCVRSAQKDTPFTDQTEVSRLNKAVPSGSTMNQKHKTSFAFPARLKRYTVTSSDGTKERRLTMNHKSVHGISDASLESRVGSRFEPLNLQKPLSPIAEEDTCSVSDDMELESHVRDQLELLNIENSTSKIELPRAMTT